MTNNDGNKVTDKLLNNTRLGCADAERGVDRSDEQIPTAMNADSPHLREHSPPEGREIIMTDYADYFARLHAQEAAKTAANALN